MGKGFINGRMGERMMECGKRIRNMDLGSILGKMEGHTQDIFLTIKSTVKGN